MMKDNRPAVCGIHRLEKLDGARHILFVIGQWLFFGIANRLQPGEMDHHIRTEGGKAVLQGAAIAQVGPVDFKRAV